MSIRQNLIRLAYANPALRPHILPLIRKSATDVNMLLLPFMGELSELARFQADRNTTVKLAHEFQAACRDAFEQSSMGQLGIGIAPGFAMRLDVRDGSFNYDMVVGDIPSTWDEEGDILTESADVHFPTQIHWVQDVTLPLVGTDGILRAFAKRVRRFDMDISNVEPADVLRALHGYKREMARLFQETLINGASGQQPELDVNVATLINEQKDQVFKWEPEPAESDMDFDFTTDVMGVDDFVMSLKGLIGKLSGSGSFDVSRVDATGEPRDRF